ncbi:MAG TPA: MEDS domain-containing protein [Polyangia bacterium]
MSGAPDDFPSLKPGGHVCLPYANEEDKQVAVAGFIHDGLLHGERCVYFGPAASFAALIPYLDRRGIPVSTLCDRASLIFVDSENADSPAFDADIQSASIRAAVASARSEGYTGLRIAGDPSPKTRASIDHEQLAAFETSISKVFSDVRATGLCAFDQRTTKAASLEVALATHEVAIVAGRLCPNPYFKPSEPVSGSPSEPQRVAWMAANILETATARELLEAESAALIVENSRFHQRDAEYRRQIAALSRAVEARDRLIITAARWLSRPMPAMCSQLEELAKSSRLQHYQAELETCDEHLAAVTRLSRGLDEIASFLQMQVVLRPEDLDLVEVARAAIAEFGEEEVGEKVEVALEGSARIIGPWDRLRLTRLFYSMIRTAREQGYDARVRLRLDDLLKFVRVRLEFMLPHAPSLSDSGERVRSLAYGPSGESDYERLAVQLWSAREIVRMMGGTLGISTWADARVIFTLDLPKSSLPSPSGDTLSSLLPSEERSSGQ